MKSVEKLARLVVVGRQVVLVGFGGIQKFRIQNQADNPTFSVHMEKTHPS